MQSNANDTSLPALLERAVAVAGGDVLGEPSFTDTAELLLDSCRQSARLNPLGAKVLAKVIVRHLVNRLHLHAYVKAQPEVAVSPLEAAVVVTGLPRTGTTLLHRLLALDPSVRVLRFWEGLHPIPPEPDGEASGAALVRQAASWLERFYELVPAFRTIHPSTPEGPEECDALLQNTFASQHFDDMFDAEDYSAWLNTAPLRQEYADYALQLRVLGSADEAARAWVLKSPSHLGHLDAVTEQLPEALIVHCHRHPRQAVPSYASLVLALRRAYSDEVSPAVVGRQALHRCSLAMARALAVRDRLGPPRFVDVPYDALVREPLRVVADIYERSGRELPDGVREGMTRWMADNPQHRHGVHRYDLAQFGLSEEAVSGALAPYLERFTPELVPS